MHKQGKDNMTNNNEWTIEFHIATEDGTNPKGTLWSDKETAEDAEEELNEMYFNLPTSDLVYFGDWDGMGDEELVIDKIYKSTSN